MNRDPLPAKAIFVFLAVSATLPTVAQPGQTAFATMYRTTKDSTASTPCDATGNFAERATDFSTTACFSAAVGQLQQRTQADSVHEHILSFGRTQNGEVISSALYTGGRSSGLAPAVPNAFADLHNHPKNTPPSSGDVYGLLRKNRRDANFTLRYVLTPTGDAYALVVTDTARARAFLERYPAQQVPGFSPLFPDAVLTEYREILHRYGAPEELVMAYVLEKYEAGAVLLKKSESGAFKRIKVLVAGSGDARVYLADNCP